MPKLILLSSVVIIAVIVSIDSASTSATFHWNTTSRQFEGDLITEFTRFLTTISANASNLSSADSDLECWSELLGLSIGLQSNELWALKCNYKSIITVLIITLLLLVFLILVQFRVFLLTFDSVVFVCLHNSVLFILVLRVCFESRWHKSSDR